MDLFIILLDDAVENNIINSDKLDETDTILFVYKEEGGEDKPVLSLKLYQKLRGLMCKTEFIGLDVPNQDDLELFLAYLCGKYPGAQAIGSSEQLKRLWMLGIKTYPDLKSATASTSRGREKKKETTGKAGTIEQKKRGRPRSKIERSKTSLLSETEQNNVVEKNCSASISMETLKSFLSELKTEKLDPSSLCMTIYDAAERVIGTGSDMEQEIEKAVVIPEKIEAVKEALQGSYDQIIEIAKKIMADRREHETDNLLT
ncbi:MAG: hypothetical protein K2O59_01680 [Lachnospiraceae bacterium]|nr:hypothetical protein [Lachnospiraceae bacterium]MDE7176501.1 hypothetical protein [Lachnospiraceae bacterium]